MAWQTDSVIQSAFGLCTTQCTESTQRCHSHSQHDIRTGFSALSEREMYHSAKLMFAK